MYSYNLSRRCYESMTEELASYLCASPQTMVTAQIDGEPVYRTVLQREHYVFSKNQETLKHFIRTYDIKVPIVTGVNLILNGEDNEGIVSLRDSLGKVFAQ